MKKVIAVTKQELPLRVVLKEGAESVEYEVHPAGKKKLGLFMKKPDHKPEGQRKA